MKKSTTPTAAASTQTVKVAAAFLKNPTVERDSELLALFRADLRAAKFAIPRDAFIEWGCVEHDVIHIFAHDGQQIIELNPKARTPSWAAC